MMRVRGHRECLFRTHGIGVGGIDQCHKVLGSEESSFLLSWMDRPVESLFQ